MEKIYDESSVNKERFNKLKKLVEEHKKEIVTSCGDCNKIKKLLQILEEEEGEEKNVKTSEAKKEENIEKIREDLLQTFMQKKALESINNKYVLINPFNKEDRKFIRLVSKFAHVVPTKIKTNEFEKPVDVFELRIMWDKAGQKMKKYQKTSKKYRFLIIPTHLSLLFYGHLNKDEIEETKKIINETQKNIIEETKQAADKDTITTTGLLLAPMAFPLIARLMTPPPSKVPLSFWQRIKQKVYDQYDKIKSGLVGKNEFAQRFIETSAIHKFMDKEFNERKKEYNRILSRKMALLLSAYNLASAFYVLGRQQPIQLQPAIETETELLKGSNDMVEKIIDPVSEVMHGALSQTLPNEYLQLYNFFNNYNAPMVDLIKGEKIRESIKSLPFHKKVLFSIMGIVFHGTPSLKKIADKLATEKAERMRHNLNVLSSTLALLYHNNINPQIGRQIAEASYAGYIKNIQPSVEQI
jgi:hypothetical protein